MDFYFIYGPDFDNIISGMRLLTGEASMLPRWAFGYIQSKERYSSQAELISIAEEYRKRGIPIDCIVQDWKYWTGDKWGQKAFDHERYPEPAVMIKALHDLNIKLMISIWPNMATTSEDYREMKEKGFLLGDYSTYDAFDIGARELYWQQVCEGLFSSGLDAWWYDSTEPFSSSDWKGESKMEPWERMTVVGADFKKYLDPEFVNAYSLLHSRCIYEGQRRAKDNKRVLNLIRSSYPGQQKFGTVAWSGDISARWDVMKSQIVEG